MSEWMNGSTFAPGIYGTTDPILGNSAEGENTFVIPRDNSTPLVISHFPRLVTTRGSAYTFLPSITACVSSQVFHNEDRQEHNWHGRGLL
jgi:hypothetical protein